MSVTSAKLKYLAVIPARGGSVGLPKKNILPVGGLPLIAWTIGQALGIEGVRVVVSTDCQEIAQAARSHGAEVPFLRPKELSLNSTPTEPVMLHALDYYALHNFIPDAVILLQPTSPLRLPGSVGAAIRLFEESQGDSLLSVCENHHFFWKNSLTPEALYNFKERPRRQDIQPEDRLYRENGSIYITKTLAFRESKNRLCGQIAMFVMKEEESWEIDSRADLVAVSSLMAEFL